MSTRARSSNKSNKKRKLHVELELHDQQQQSPQQQPKPKKKVIRDEEEEEEKKIVFDHDVVEESDNESKAAIAEEEQDGSVMHKTVEWLDAGEAHDDWEEELDGVVHSAVMHRSVWYKSSVINVGDFVEVYSDTNKLWWCYVMELYELVPQDHVKQLQRLGDSASLWAGSSAYEWDQFTDNNSNDKSSRLGNGGKGMMYVMWCMSKEEITELDADAAVDMRKKEMALNVTEKEMHPQPLGCVVRKVPPLEVLSKVKHSLLSGVSEDGEAFHKVEPRPDIVSFMKSKVSVWYQHDNNNGSEEKKKEQQPSEREEESVYDSSVVLCSKAVQSPVTLLRDLAIAHEDFMLQSAYYKTVVEPYEVNTLLSFGRSAGAAATKEFVNTHWKNIYLSPMPRNLEVVVQGANTMCFLCKEHRNLRYTLEVTNDNSIQTQCLGSDCYVRLYTLLEIRNTLLHVLQMTQRNKALPTKQFLKDTHSRVKSLLVCV